MTRSMEHYREHFDPSDPETVKNWWDVVSYLREECPVTHSDAHGGFWNLTRYADVCAAAQDWQTFTSAKGTVFPRSPEMKLIPPVESDPPIQREWRRILNPLFTPAMVAGMEPLMREIATELIDEFIEDGAVDIVKSFAMRLPGTVFFKIGLGIEDNAELQQVLEWVHYVLQDVGPNTPAAYASFVQWLIDLLVERRDKGPYRGDVIDALLEARRDGEPYSIDDELMPVLMMVAFGGLDTIQNATGNIVLRLCQDAAVGDWLREDMTRIPRALHEFMRIDPPAVFQTRVTTRDVSMGDQVIPAGERVGIHLGTANRDPREFDEPDKLDFERPHTRNLAFGMGVHRCIGSHFALLELKVVVEELVTRLRNLQLTDPDIPYSYPRGRGPRSLKVSFDPGPRLKR